MTNRYMSAADLGYEPPPATVTRLAREFYLTVVRSLTRGELRQVRRRNLAYGPGVCATHDFCDANELMDCAFYHVVGHSICEGDDGLADPDAVLWGAAWDLAKKDYLTFNRHWCEERHCDKERKEHD